MLSAVWWNERSLIDCNMNAHLSEAGALGAREKRSSAQALVALNTRERP